MASRSEKNTFQVPVSSLKENAKEAWYKQLYQLIIENPGMRIKLSNTGFKICPKMQPSRKTNMPQ